MLAPPVVPANCANAPHPRRRVSSDGRCGLSVGRGWLQPRGSQELWPCALIRRTSEHLPVLTARQRQKPNDAEHKETNPESVQNYAQDRWPPGIASSLRVDVYDHRSRDLGSRRMIDPFANTERQEAKSDRKSGDKLLPKGGDGDQAACGGHNVPPTIGLKSIQVHGKSTSPNGGCPGAIFSLSGIVQADSDDAG
jgi:hypothetical protein